MMDEDRKEVLRLYNELKKKYDLEDLELLEEEFGVYFAVPTAFISEILSIIIRRLQAIRNSINIFYQPTTFIENYESKFLTKKEKEQMFTFFKKVVAYDWEYASEVNKGEKERAEFLKKAINFYRKEAKTFIQKLGNKMKEEWLAEEKEKDVMNYIH
jgi:hypothetical protein